MLRLALNGSQFLEGHKSQSSPSDLWVLSKWKTHVSSSKAFFRKRPWTSNFNIEHSIPTQTLNFTVQSNIHRHKYGTPGPIAILLMGAGSFRWRLPYIFTHSILGSLQLVQIVRNKYILWLLNLMYDDRCTVHIKPDWKIHVIVVVVIVVVCFRAISHVRRPDPFVQNPHWQQNKWLLSLWVAWQRVVNEYI